MVVSVPGKISAVCLGFLGLLVGLAAPAFGQGAGSEYPMRRIADMFQPLSRPAEMIHVTAMLVLLISAIIFLVVTGMLIYIVVKYRRPENDDGNEPPQIYGSTNIELAWTVIPILITVVLVLVTSRTIGEIQNPDSSRECSEGARGGSPMVVGSALPGPRDHYRKRNSHSD